MSLLERIRACLADGDKSMAELYATFPVGNKWLRNVVFMACKHGKLARNGVGHGTRYRLPRAEDYVPPVRKLIALEEVWPMPVELPEVSNPPRRHVVEM